MRRQHTRINAYLTEDLGLEITNTRWSWQAQSQDGQVVVLIVWDDESERRNGVDHVRVWTSENSRGAAEGRPGPRQRRRSVNRLRAGERLYAIVRAGAGTAQPGDKRDYDAGQILALGRPALESDGRELAPVVDVLTADRFQRSFRRKQS
ncbi:hypothetical protein GCM10025864_02010 [Luteimicrobium album]|uniref:Uncharacterized protein n=1 Tax=Luteimicrobium album TaxID=1054550 RepID=A0ABQ6HWT6_9MICO|nr:hypothetical protein GCM10025864_02010 [Luteimicrobium album]